MHNDEKPSTSKRLRESLKIKALEELNETSAGEPSGSLEEERSQDEAFVDATISSVQLEVDSIGENFSSDEEDEDLARTASMFNIKKRIKMMKALKELEFALRNLK